MKSEHPGPVVGERANLQAIDCAACGYIHLNPLPDPRALDRYYASEFWQTTKSGSRAEMEAESDWLDAINSDWLALLSGTRGSGLLLDVGCGYGWFLRAAIQAGFGADGIEPNKAAARYAEKNSGAYVAVGTRDSLMIAAQWDYIAALWVLEHLLDPRAFLEWSRERLVPGGRLLLVVPNDFRALQLEVNPKVERPFWWLAATHINYFRPETLWNLLGRAGLRVVDYCATYPMERALARGLDYTAEDNADLGANLHSQVRAMDLSDGQEKRRARYHHDLNGRELVVVAEVE